MNDKKEKKLALVTGASKGIGRAVAIEFAKCGYDIIVNYFADKAGALKTLEYVKDNGSNGMIMQFDVASFDATSKAVDEIIKTYDAIDVLVNNAGITADGLFIMMGKNKWDSVINTSKLFCCKSRINRCKQGSSIRSGKAWYSC